MDKAVKPFASLPGVPSSGLSLGCVPESVKLRCQRGSRLGGVWIDPAQLHFATL